MTYTERLHALATEMARVRHKTEMGSPAWDGAMESLSEKERQWRINKFIPSAEVAMKHSAQIAYDAFAEGANNKSITWDQHIHSQGLVPENKEQ